MANIKPTAIAAYCNAKVHKAQKANLKKWQKKVKPVIKKEIQSRIAKGQSPVAGAKAYTKYSDGYKKAITKKLGPTFGKKIRPVNLKLSGRMLKSLSVRATIKGIVVYFTSGIHKYHNGEGRVRRATLPLEGEKFKRPIRKKMSDLYIKLFKIS